MKRIKFQKLALHPKWEKFCHAQVAGETAAYGNGEQVITKGFVKLGVLRKYTNNKNFQSDYN